MPRFPFDITTHSITFRFVSGLVDPRYYLGIDAYLTEKGSEFFPNQI